MCNGKYGDEVFNYMLQLEEEVDPNILMEKLISISPKKRNSFMSAAQKLINQGMQQGIQLGEEKGIEKGMEKGMEKGIFTKAIAVAKNMLLKLKLDIDTVQKATELPKAELEKILQGSR